MNTVRKTENARHDVLAMRRRQKQLGRQLRLMYEQFLQEPIPADMLEALRREEERTELQLPR
jgi:hypothetical protein